jgi:hypothetical protein
MRHDPTYHALVSAEQACGCVELTCTGGCPAHVVADALGIAPTAMLCTEHSIAVAARASALAEHARELLAEARAQADDEDHRAILLTEARAAMEATLALLDGRHS